MIWSFCILFLGFIISATGLYYWCSTPRPTYLPLSSMASLPYVQVVAHFKESLSWITDQQAHYTIVYHKGQLEKNPRFWQWFTLPNVGREGHSYLTFFVEFYDRLPECIHLTQASPPEKEQERLLDWRTTTPEFQAYWLRFLPRPKDGQIRYVPHACFTVTREQVRSRPRSLYLDLMESLSKDVNPIEGHYVEKMWWSLFHP